MLERPAVAELPQGQRVEAVKSLGQELKETAKAFETRAGEIGAAVHTMVLTSVSAVVARAPMTAPSARRERKALSGAAGCSGRG